MGVVGTAVCTQAVFWGFNSFLLFLDFFQRPAFLLRYKIQDTEPTDHAKMWRAVRRVAFNWVVVTYPVLYTAHRLFVWRGVDFGPELPTFPWVVWELFIMIWVEEICFYYSHRLVHLPLLYRRIHKIHHEWTAPIGVVAVYAHPVEHVISNVLPPLLGPLVTGCHITTAWMWFAIALVSTSISHSGYHFPFLPSPEAHDYHHLKFNQNYGVLGVLDRLHGTDSKFRKSKAYERHFLSLTLVPVRQLIPEDPKAKAL